MKKIKVLGIRTLESNSQASTEDQGFYDGSTSNAEQSISREVVKKKPIRINSNGFTSWARKIRPTKDGMESEVEEPLIIVESGHMVKETEIKGQCDICGGYDRNIFNCHVYGCKKPLCLKHVYFFDYGKGERPYCFEDYKRVVDEFDTWQEYENRGKK